MPQSNTPLNSIYINQQYLRTTEKSQAVVIPIKTEKAPSGAFKDNLN
jgi:hypothetical protein